MPHQENKEAGQEGEVKMFTPLLRHTAIDTTCSNLIMAGLLERKEVARYMHHISVMTDSELAEQLLESRRLLDGHYRQVGKARRN